MRWRTAVSATLVAGVVVALVGGAISAGFGPRDTTRLTEIAMSPKPADAQPVVIRDVLSGDTVVVSVTEPGAVVQQWGTDVTARLIGVDSPNFGITPDCYAVEAQARLAELLPEGSVAWVTTDVEQRDAGGRWLMYLWGADERFVNVLLPIDGFVRAEDMPPNDTLMPEIRAAASNAASRFAGLWGDCRG